MTTELLDTREATDDEVFEAIKARLRVGWMQGANGDYQGKGPVCLYGAFIAVTNPAGDSFDQRITPTQRARIWGCLDRKAADDYGQSAIGFNDRIARNVGDVIEFVRRVKDWCKR